MEAGAVFPKVKSPELPEIGVQHLQPMERMTECASEISLKVAEGIFVKYQKAVEKEAAADAQGGIAFLL